MSAAPNPPNPGAPGAAGPSAAAGPSGATVLLTGLPSAGKTTLAGAAVDALRTAGRAVESLDGDVVRGRFWPELGMSPADRERNLDRMGGLAALLARNGVVAVISAIAPFADARAAMRAEHTANGVEFLEIHVATSLAECRRRDVKGLYARQARGELTGLTGVDATYEAPEEPALRIDTEGRAVADSAATLVTFLLERLGQEYRTEVVRARRSAGVLLFRRVDGGVEVLLGHPGGPLWARKDDGAWSVPKGEYADDEEPRVAAEREFGEEIGLALADVSAGPVHELGELRLPSGKRLTVFAVEGDLDPAAAVSNTFEMPWPPRSGRIQSFPELDRVAWFDLPAARAKITKGQLPLLDRLPL